MIRLRQERHRVIFGDLEGCELLYNFADFDRMLSLQKAVRIEVCREIGNILAGVLSRRELKVRRDVGALRSLDGINGFVRAEAGAFVYIVPHADEKDTTGIEEPTHLIRPPGLGVRR